MKRILFFLFIVIVTSCGSSKQKENNKVDSIQIQKARINYLIETFSKVYTYDDSNACAVVINDIKKEFPDFLPETLTNDETQPAVLQIRLEYYNKMLDQQYNLSKQ